MAQIISHEEVSTAPIPHSLFAVAPTPSSAARAANYNLPESYCLSAVPTRKKLEIEDSPSSLVS